MILLGLSWYAVRGWSERSRPFAWPPALGFVLMCVSFVLMTFFQSAALRPLPWPLVVAVVLAIAGFCHFRWGTRASTLAFFACAFALYTYMITRVAHTDGANMLEIVEAASREFLSGKQPYHLYEPIAGDAPFFYLPGLWLPYAAFVSLGVDLRVLNLVVLVLFAVLFETSLPKPGRAEILAATLYPFLLSSPLAVMVVHGHVWPYWLLICGAMVLLMKSRLLLAAMLYGLSMATRQPSLFLMGPLAAYLYREIGFKSTLKYAAVAAAVALAVLLPFALWTGSEFWRFTYLAPGGGGTLQPHVSADSLVSSGSWKIGHAYWQAAIFLLGSAVVLFRPAGGASWFVFIAGVTYCWLVFFNIYAVRYVYFPGFLLIALALCSRLAVGWRPWNTVLRQGRQNRSAISEHADEDAISRTATIDANRRRRWCRLSVSRLRSGPRSAAWLLPPAKP